MEQAISSVGKQVSEATVRVRYAETDRMGRVYQANYFIWFEVGRSALIRDFGGVSYGVLEERGLLLPATECYCHYILPCTYEDELTVRTWVAEMGRVRLRMEYEIINQASGQRVAEGFTIHAFADKQGRPLRLRDHPELYEPMARAAGLL